MREVYYMLLDERNRLSKLAEQLKYNIANNPKGRINVHTIKGKYFQYSIQEENGGEIIKRYARRTEMELVRKLAQTNYDSEALRIIEDRIFDIDRLLEKRNGNNLIDLYEDMSIGRKRLIFPLELPDEEYIEKWKKNMLLSENTYPKLSNIMTENGEQVRSKTEKILADKLLKNHIPYVYEPKVVLNDGKYLFPDFAMLNVRLRKTYYHEHFGMMDNPEYSIRTIEKIEEYQRNGYWPGKNMLYTFETKSRMPDMRNLDKMIINYLK